MVELSKTPDSLVLGWKALREWRLDTGTLRVSIRVPLESMKIVGCGAGNKAHSNCGGGAGNCGGAGLAAETCKKRNLSRQLAETLQAIAALLDLARGDTDGWRKKKRWKIKIKRKVKLIKKIRTKY